MPLPKSADPFGTWWTVKSKDPGQLLHGVMFFKKLEGELAQKHKSSSVSDEEVIATALKNESLLRLGQAWTAKHRSKKLKTEAAPAIEPASHQPLLNLSQSSSSSSSPEGTMPLRLLSIDWI